MANTLGGVNLAQIAQQTLETLSAEMPVVSAFTTDFSSDVADVGESVSTRVASAVSAGDATSGYSATDVTSTAKTITLNKHKHFTAKFTDLEIAKGGLDLLERTFVRPAVHSVVNAMMDDKEIEELVQSINDGKDVTNNSIFRIMVAINNRVKQLYQQTYKGLSSNVVREAFGWSEEFKLP